MPEYEMHFALHEGEELLAVAHRHVTTLCSSLVGAIAWLSLPFFFLFPLLKLGISGVVLLMISSVLAIAFAVRVLLRWRRDVCVITTQRVICVDPRVFRLDKIEEIGIRAIREVAWRRRGWMDRLWGRGTVTIRSDIHSLRKEGVSHPAEFCRYIEELRCPVTDDKR
jgi:hypothetical protein